MQRWPLQINHQQLTCDYIRSVAKPSIHTLTWRKQFYVLRLTKEYCSGICDVSLGVITGSHTGGSTEVLTGSIRALSENLTEVWHCVNTFSRKRLLCMQQFSRKITWNAWYCWFPVTCSWYLVITHQIIIFVIEFSNSVAHVNYCWINGNMEEK